MHGVPFAASCCAPAGSRPRRSARSPSSGRPSAWISTAPRSTSTHFSGVARRAVWKSDSAQGEVIGALAKAHPETDHLGIEVHRAGVGRLLLHAQEERLANLRIMCHDAVEVLERSIADESFDSILIFFPDPWHKKRHHKRRLIDTAFVELLAAKLKTGGVLRLATDWQAYAEQMLRVGNACERLRIVERGSHLCRAPGVSRRRRDSSGAARAWATACGIWPTSKPSRFGASPASTIETICCKNPPRPMLLRAKIFRCAQRSLRVELMSRTAWDIVRRRRR